MKLTHPKLSLPLTLVLMLGVYSVLSYKAKVRREEWVREQAVARSTNAVGTVIAREAQTNEVTAFMTNRNERDDYWEKAREEQQRIHNRGYFAAGWNWGSKGLSKEDALANFDLITTNTLPTNSIHAK